ncbi:hypothetical protein THAOC_11540, partial [Thalassiosira oceanica]
DEEKLDEVSLRSLKATLTLEQIMQASVVAHTMQHWQTFLKWNRRLYKELSKGYSEGRGTFDPRDGWYKGEIGFFDFYIIPLARKLKDCGVFGSAATEYLDHALEIRRRWEEEGEEIAERMIAEHDEALRNALEKEAKESKKSNKDEAKESNLPPYHDEQKEILAQYEHWGGDTTLPDNLPGSVNSAEQIVRLEYYLLYTPEPKSYPEVVANVRFLISTTNVPFVTPYGGGGYTTCISSLLSLVASICAIFLPSFFQHVQTEAGVEVDAAGGV